MLATGIDLGGTKIETQVYDAEWQLVNSRRVATPRSYPELIDALAAEAAWAKDLAGHAMPVGLAAPGILQSDGTLLAANLCASGHPLPDDISEAVGHPVTFMNDGRAQALSEAIFGAGKGNRTVAALIMGTGVGVGVTVDDLVHIGPNGLAGEFGHVTASAHLIEQHRLPIFACGCGRQGCVETYLSGPGLQRLAQHFAGETLESEAIVARRSGDMAGVWHVWCELTADLMRTIALTLDPDVIVLGGGLSRVDGVVDDISSALEDVLIGACKMPRVALALGGDASGGRGAAHAACRASGGAV